MASWNAGESVGGRFVLVRRLAAAAGTETWVAEDREARARRVLKVATDRAARPRIAREAELLSALAHPGLVACHGTVEIDGALALITDHLPGGDLAALAAGPWRTAIASLAPALAALAHAHARGVAHGDLKPSNLVRGEDGGARLVDLGVAAAVATGAIARGSPYSRSPAQAAGAPPTPADDLWGLGALLTELTSGAPPGYAGVPQVPPDLPAPLAALIERLRSEDPAARGTLDEARATLASLAAAPGPAPRPFAPAGWRPPVPAAEPPRVRAPDRPTLMGVALLAVAALAVFVVLPRWVREHPPEVSVAPSTPSVILAAKEAAAPKALPSTPEGIAELARAKTRAEEARASFEKAKAALDRDHAEVWGGADYARLTGSASDADARYKERDYAAAAAAWAVATEIAPRITAARAPSLAAALAAGHSAFGRGDAPAAVAAYERALAIDPNSGAAKAGLARAKTLEPVLALLDAGSALEKQGDIDGAAGKYREALKLDPATGAASAGLARLAARATQSGFAQAMAQGQKALAAGDRVRARASFEHALALEPGASEAKDALAQLAVDDQAATIARQRAAAEAAVREERWADAVRAYDAALALDGTLVFAQSGRALAEPRAALAQRIARTLASPARLESPEGRNGARALLAEASDTLATAGAAPVLKREVASLEQAIALAETPVHVTLVSDNLTEVIVYRVARLGVFASHELDLLPGRYTIVGRRVGYRDVRREVEIAPGGTPPAAIDIRCTEPI